MYLDVLHIENVGPIEKINLTLPFNVNGDPKPLILVGENGSGKTTALSIIADALMEAAATGFDDILKKENEKRSWFRMVGGLTARNGATYSCSSLKFIHDSEDYHFLEKWGVINSSDIPNNIPDSLKGAPHWASAASHKNFDIDQEKSRAVIGSGAYAFFPSDRAETPHWMNSTSIFEDDLIEPAKLVNKLRRPIYIRKSLENIKHWLTALLIDKSISTDQNSAASDIWMYANSIVNKVVGNGMVLGWAGRKAGSRLTIHRPKESVLPSFMSVSAGQSTLLSIFGTILRYGDLAIHDLSNPADIRGICLIDEVDNHAHVKIQYEVIPKLIKMFPKVQFIVSSHSPLFILGMENLFTSDGILILDMPSGTPIQSEAYSEFGHAFKILQETKAFNAEIEKISKASTKILVLLEGETDPIYMKCAASVLEDQEILDNVEFEWVGAKDHRGQGFNTGDNALNNALNLFRSKQNIVERKIVLLYDSDTNKPEENFSKVYVRRIPHNVTNTIFKKGVENLLNYYEISDEFRNIKISIDDYGCENKRSSLNKMKLCKYLCEEEVSRDHFINFTNVFSLLKLIIADESNIE